MCFCGCYTFVWSFGRKCSHCIFRKLPGSRQWDHLKEVVSQGIEMFKDFNDWCVTTVHSGIQRRCYQGRWKYPLGKNSTSVGWSRSINFQNRTSLPQSSHGKKVKLIWFLLHIHRIPIEENWNTFGWSKLGISYVYPAVILFPLVVLHTDQISIDLKWELYLRKPSQSW